MNDNIKYRLLLFLLEGIAHLPLSVLYGISNFMYVIVCYVVHYRKDIVRENLYRVFPEKSDDERYRLQKSYYHYLCDLIVEIVKTLHISDKELNRRIKIVDIDVFSNPAKEGHPVFVYLGHYGNWEWAQHLYDHIEGPEVFGQIYRRIRDKASDRLMLKVRSRFKGVNIEQETALRTLLKMSKQHRSFLISFLSDQHPNTENMRYWTQFLGQESAYVVGAEEIGKRIDARFVYLDIERPRRGYYVMTCRRIENADDDVNANPHPYTLSYLRMMEASIRRQPELWLWSHRRWLYTREGYEQHMREFHELLRQRTQNQ